MSLKSKLRVLLFLGLTTLVGAGLGEAAKTAVKYDEIQSVKKLESKGYFNDGEIAKIREEYAFLGPTDRTYLEWGAGIGAVLGLIGYAASRSEGSIRIESECEDDDRMPPVSHYRAGY